MNHQLHLQALVGSEQPLYIFLREGEEEADRLTARDLDRRARGIAAALRELCAPGDRALLLFPAGLDFIAAFFGCLYAGVIAVPAYPPHPRRGHERLRTIARDSRPAAVLTSTESLLAVESAASRIPEITAVRRLVCDSLPEVGPGEGAPDFEPAPEAPAFLQYTSGSTGAPKGVIVTHGNLAHNEEMIRQAFGQGPGSVVVGWLPLYHDMGLIGNILQPLWAGGSCVLMSPIAFLQRPRRWLEAIGRYGGTTSGGPNFAYELCVEKIAPAEREGLDLSTWRVAFNGAEPVRAATLSRFTEAFAPCGFRREAFYPCYGLAEATLFVAGPDRGDPPAVGAFDAEALAADQARPAGVDEPGARRLVSCGAAWSGQRIAIVDSETAGELPPGRVGEVWVAGPSVAAGYWGQPEETSRVFGARLARGVAGGPFLRTGDLGFISGGELFIAGRSKDLIILRGRNHYPQDLEATAEASHPDLQPGGIAAFSIDDAEAERLVIVAEARRRREAGMDVSAVADAVRSALAGEHEVRVDAVALIRAGTLPRTSSGKVQRRAARAAYLDGGLEILGHSRIDEGLGTTAAARPELPADLSALPESARRAALTAWLRQAVGAACRVAPESLPAARPLAALGLDSLGSVSLRQEIEELLGIALPMSELLGDTTIEGLAEQLAAAVSTPGITEERSAVPAETAPEGITLTAGQQALWFLDRLAPENAVYNLAAAARVHGELDVTALARALGELAQRHPALRTTFSSLDGVLRQRVEPSLAPGFAVVDATGWSAGELAERLAAEARLPFDLATGPPVRWRLFVRSPRESTLLLAIHHLVSDFWSIVVLLRDLETLYLRGPALPPLSATYADFVRWQESRLAGDAGERLRRFWESELAPPLPVLDLPSDRPRPSEQSFRGGSTALVLPPALVAGLLRLSREHGATLFMTLLGLLTALLHRASGQEEVVVGAPTSGRGEVRFSDLVGYFVNPIALRARFAGDPSFAGHLGALRERVLAAYAHQDYPFVRVSERLHPERDPSRPPVFQALLTLQKAQRPELEPLAGFALGEEGDRLEWGGLDLEAVRLAGRPAPFDLSLGVAEIDGALRASLQFSSDLFDAVTARRWLERFAVLAQGAVATPERRLGSLPWMTAGERAQIQVEWNDTAAPPPSEEPIHRLIERQASRVPESLALICGPERLTYRELNARANRLARHLLAQGLRPEGRVGVCLDRSTEMVVALLGVLKAGGAYVPLDPAYPRERLALILEDAGIDLLVAEARRAGSFGPGVRIVDPVADREAIRRRREDDLPRSGDLPGGLAYLIYTSGSTGRPKGVMVGHRNVSSFFAAMDRRLGAAPGCWLAATSISFDISVLELLWTLSRGYRVVVRRGQTRLTGEAPSAGRALDISLFFFASDAESLAPGRAKYRLLLEAARRADRLGFSAVWTPERHFHAFGGLYPNPSVTGAALAAITERIEIRAGSVVLPLHHPVRVAEEWAVVDNLSDGRAGIAFASGWNAADFVFAPERFATRKRAMVEQIEVVRRLWRGEAVRLPGGAGEVEVRSLPRPVQAELPVWLTAAGSAETFRLAGELGANLLTHLLGQSLREVAEKVAVYRQAWRAAGHPGEGKVSLMLHTFLGESLEAVRETVREPLVRYLATSLDLMKVLAPDQDFAALSGEDQAVLLERAFDRYFETSGLFGTVESCRGRIRELQAIGVDEIACLLDFGVATDAVLAGLEPLAELRRTGPAAMEEAEEETIPAQISRHGVTHFQCTPSALTALLLDPEAPAAIARLERLLVGGEALPPPLAERAAGLMRGELLNMYGPTETAIWSATDRVEAAGAVTLGRPIANTSLHVVDGGEELAPAGQPGELLIGGEGVVRGYWGRPDLTAERFVPDPFSGRPGARLYRTGDRAQWRADGRLAFLGRLDHQVKIRGHRIELGEIEATLARHPAVREAVVVAREEVPGDLASVRLVAYVVPASAAGEGAELPPDPERVERALAGHDRYRLPNGAVVAHLSAEQTSAIYREIFEQEIYLRHGVTLPAGACVFDVGANIGLFTLFAARRCPGIRLYAFEPIPPTFAALRANAELHGRGARVFPLGLSDREEEAAFTFYPKMAGLSGRFAAGDETVTSSIVHTWLQTTSGSGSAGLSSEEVTALVTDMLQAEIHQCRLRPLSALIRELGVERIDLLKVDVEKSELRVLQGVSDEDWPRIGQIVIEVHTRELLDGVSALLAGRGYDLQVDEFIPTGEAGEFVWMLYAIRRGWEPAAAEAPRAPTLAVPELRGFLQGILPSFLVPDSWVALDALPLTPNGKVDRRALPAPEAGRPAPAGYLEPETLLQRTIAEIWRELLGVDRVGLRDSFFELGGNSLLMVEAHGRLRRALGREIPLRALLRGQTVEALAESLDALPVEAGAAASAPPLRPSRRAARSPLSFAQERLWFLQRLAPESPVLNVASAFRLRGELDVAALSAGFGEICRRHEILRTRIGETEGTPWQEVLSPRALPLPVVDLAGLPAPGRELQRRADAEAARPFDLAAGGLLRALLLRLAPHEHVLVLTIHHLGIDAWSQEILFGELAELYEGFAAGRPPRLPELPLQYADYALWQRQWGSSDAVEPQLAFWRRQLAAAPPAPWLPGQRERAAVPRFRGAVHRFELPPETAEALRQLSRAEAGTLFMTLLAAFSSLLHQSTGQAELLIGTNVADRNAGEITRLIGYFVNTLALRIDLAGDPTFRELLRRVRETTLASFAHQEVPFERVMADLQPRRQGSYAPLFKVMFVMQSSLPRAWRMPGLETAPFELGHHTANFDLMVLMAERGDGGLLGAFLFDTDLFEAAAMERMAAHFAGLLAGVGADPDQTLSGIDAGEDAAADWLADQFNEGLTR